MLLLSIDVGLKNMALVLFRWKCHPRHAPEIIGYERIDLTNLPHRRICMSKCNIPHTNEMADHVAHFIQEYFDWLNEADKILIERQPPGGLTEIHSLLLFKFRSKTTLISPNAVHAYYTINHLNYEERKVRSLLFARNRHPGVIPETDDRWHDVSDAIMMGHWWCSQQKVPVPESSLNSFESFRYLPSENSIPYRS